MLRMFGCCGKQGVNGLRDAADPNGFNSDYSNANQGNVFNTDGQVFNSDVAQGQGQVFNSDVAAGGNVAAGPGAARAPSDVAPPSGYPGGPPVNQAQANQPSGFWNAVGSVFRVVGTAVPAAAPVLQAGQAVACAAGAGALCNMGGIPGAFPPGSIAAYQNGRWMVAAPRTAPVALHGLAGPPILDRTTMARAITSRQAGQAPVDASYYAYARIKNADRPYRSVRGLAGNGLGMSAPPAYMIVGASATQPAGVTVVTLTKFQELTGTLPWYKMWQVWLGVGGAAAAGGLGYVALKKRRPAAT